MPWASSLHCHDLSCAQVAGEVLGELCGQMGITDSQEVQEFALFLIKGEGEPRERGGQPCLPGPRAAARERGFCAGEACGQSVSSGVGPLRR